MNPEVPVQTMLACSQCGRAFADSDLVLIAGNRVCVDCKPAYLSRVMATGASSHIWHYGGFWIRLAARIVDGFILGLVFGVPIFVVFLFLAPGLFKAGQTPTPPNPELMLGFVFVVFVVSFVLSGCYEVLMLKYRSATLGKMVCGLKVVRPDGRDLGWGVCFGRFFMWNVVISGIPYLNMVLMLINSIMLGVDVEKRGLHDRVCDTRVIYKRA